MSMHRDVQELLGLPDDPKVELEISWRASTFEGSVCCMGEADHPATVHIDWWEINYDTDTDAPRWGGLEQGAFCFDHAREILARIIDEIKPFEWDPFDSFTMPYGAEIGSPMVKVVVLRDALVIGLKALS